MQHGDKAPDFTLNNQDDKPVSLSDFKGQWVVLYFYPKDMTPGCTKEACEFELARSLFKAHNAVILGVSRDSVNSHQKFANKHSLGFDLLSDPDHKVIETYGSWVEKSMFGKKYMGISRDTILISPGGKVAKIYRKVSPATHAKQILEVLDEK